MKNLILFALLSVVFTASAQMNLVTNRTIDLISKKTIVSKYPNYTMFFKSKYNKKDTVFIGIEADSIHPEIISPKLYAFVPKGEITNHTGLLIKFEDGTKEWFPIQYIDKEIGFVEYQFSNTAGVSLATKKVNGIILGVSNYYSKDYQTYFIDFIKLL